jgi:hypothetical protein
MNQAPPRCFAALAAALALCTTALAEETAVDETRVREALAREFAFDYADKALQEVLPDIAKRAGVEIVFDPQSAEATGTLPITWSSKRSSAERALRWVTRLADLGFKVVDGAVFVTSHEILKGQVVLKVYDVRDLSLWEEIRLGPELNFSPLPVEPGEVDVTAECLAELISQRVRPGEWAPELGTSIEERDGVLVVTQRPGIHELIERRLVSLRGLRWRPVRVEVAVLASSSFGPLEPRTRDGSLPPEEVEKLMAGAREETLFAHGELTTLESHTAHAVWGGKVHYIDRKVLEWPEARPRRDSEREVKHEVVPYGDEKTPKVLVVKTPAPKPAVPPPGKGVIVPVVDALLDGVLVEVTPRLQEGASKAELGLRVVISHPREVGGAEGPGDESISKPVVDYSRLSTTTRLPVGPFRLVGRMAVRRGARDVPVVVLARVSLDARGAAVPEE